MPKFKRTANVEFAILGSEQTVTVSNLPYVWDSDLSPHIDQQAVFDAIAYLRDLGVTTGLGTISVLTSSA
jgi:hypothetical protein